MKSLHNCGRVYWEGKLFFSHHSPLGARPPSYVFRASATAELMFMQGRTVKPRYLAPQLASRHAWAWNGFPAMHFTSLNRHPRHSPSPRLGKFHSVQFDLDMSPQTGQQPSVQPSFEQLSCSKSGMPWRQTPLSTAGATPVVKTRAESSQAKEGGGWQLLLLPLTGQRAMPRSLHLWVCLFEPLTIPKHPHWTANDCRGVGGDWQPCRPANAWMIATH